MTRESLTEFNTMQRDRDAQGPKDEPEPHEEWPVCPHCNGEGVHSIMNHAVDYLHDHVWDMVTCRKCKGKGWI